MLKGIEPTLRTTFAEISQPAKTLFPRSSGGIHIDTGAMRSTIGRTFVGATFILKLATRTVPVAITLASTHSVFSVAWAVFSVVPRLHYVHIGAWPEFVIFAPFQSLPNQSDGAVFAFQIFWNFHLVALLSEKLDQIKNLGKSDDDSDVEIKFGFRFTVG